MTFTDFDPMIFSNTDDVIMGEVTRSNSSIERLKKTDLIVFNTRRQCTGLDTITERGQPTIG